MRTARSVGNRAYNFQTVFDCSRITHACVSFHQREALVGPRAVLIQWVNESLGPRRRPIELDAGAHCLIGGQFARAGRNERENERKGADGQENQIEDSSAR